jgi:hypothetical protein
MQNAAISKFDFPRPLLPRPDGGGVEHDWGEGELGTTLKEVGGFLACQVSAIMNFLA